MPRDASEPPCISQLTMEAFMKQLALALALAFCSAAAMAAINLNTATKEELVALPGIGPAKAQAILDYRNAHGAFKSIEEVKDVKGIGAKRFEKLKCELTVVGASAKPAARPGEAVCAAAHGQGHGDAGRQARRRGGREALTRRQSVRRRTGAPRLRAGRSTRTMLAALWIARRSDSVAGAAHPLNSSWRTR